MAGELRREIFWGEGIWVEEDATKISAGPLVVVIFSV